MGWGYLPSLPATRGAAESIVNWSTPGANSWSPLRSSSKVTSWPVWAAMRPRLLVRLALTPYSTSLYGLLLRIASQRSIHSLSYGLPSFFDCQSILGRSVAWPLKVLDGG